MGPDYKPPIGATALEHAALVAALSGQTRRAVEFSEGAWAAIGLKEVLTADAYVYIEGEKRYYAPSLKLSADEQSAMAMHHFEVGAKKRAHIDAENARLAAGTRAAALPARRLSESEQRERDERLAGDAHARNDRLNAELRRREDDAKRSASGGWAQPKGGEAEESHESGAAGAAGAAAADEARKAKLEALTSERRQYGYVGKAKAKPAAATETK